jgi:hypothetical protein
LQTGSRLQHTPVLCNLPSSFQKRIKKKSEGISREQLIDAKPPTKLITFPKIA